jgi:hypothetical protein
MQNFEVPFNTGSPFLEITVAPAAFSAFTVATPMVRPLLTSGIERNAFVGIFHKRGKALEARSSHAFDPRVTTD